MREIRKPIRTLLDVFGRHKWLIPTCWFVSALVLRLLVAPIIANWYSILPTESYKQHWEYVAPLWGPLLRGLGALLPASIAPLELAAGLSALSGAALAALGPRLSRVFGASKAEAWVFAVLLAVWPAGVLLGASDAQHPTALFFWAVGLLAFGEAVRGRTDYFLPSLLAAAIMVGLRTETAFWLLLWPLLEMPKRPDLKTILFSGLLIAGFGAVAFVLKEQFSNFLELKWMVFLSSPLMIFGGLCESMPCALFLALALIVGLVFSPGKRLSLLFALLVAALPALFTGIAPDNGLSLRYFLPLGLFALFLSLRGFFASSQRLPALAPAFFALALLLLVTEAMNSFPAEKHLSFRNEAAFLREQGRNLEGVVCLLDPGEVREWPGNHKDFDTSYSPRVPEEAGAYLGLALRFRPLTENPETSLFPAECTYYYEGSACFLANTELEPEGRDIRRFRSLCEQWRTKLTAPPVAETLLRARSASRLAFESPNLSVKLFPITRD